MPKSLDIFYSDKWVDDDRILLVDKYQDTIQMMPIGITRIIRRTFAGYRVFIDGKYVFDYSILNNDLIYITPKMMKYEMYVNTAKKIAKVRNQEFVDIICVLRYKNA